MLRTFRPALKQKLPALLVGLSVLTAATLETYEYFGSRAEEIERLQQNMNESLQTRREGVEEWMGRHKTFLTALAQSPTIAEAMPAFSAAWGEIPGDPSTILQTAYVENNPFPAGERQKFISASGPLGYHRVHERFQPVIDNWRNLFGQYDVFLIDPAGDVVYTTYKEADFAANVTAGPLADSGLGHVFADALRGPEDQTQISEVAAYEPSAGAAAQFMAQRLIGADGKTTGVLVVQLPIHELTEIVIGNTAELGTTGEVYLTAPSGIYLTGSRFEDRFAALDPVPESVKAADTAGEEGQIAEDAALSSGQTGFSSNLAYEGPGGPWQIIIERDRAEVMAPVHAALILKLEILAVAAALVLAAGIFLARSITRPLDQVRARIASVAAGDLTAAVPGTDRSDEIGQIARSVDDLRNMLAMAEQAELERQDRQAEQRHVVEALTVGLQSLSAGDLTRSIDEPFANEYEALRQDFNRTIAQLGGILTRVVDTSSSIGRRSSEISRASEDLSRRTENQAAALEQTAAALDELTASVKSAAEGARAVEGIVRQARQEAEESDSVVQGAVAAMTEIEKSSEQISQIIGVIDDIAFQTSLLALNAGVEAARAGDAGRGFAVVASEVRALAQRSSAAAKEIKSLISSSTQHVGRGVDQVGRAGTALASIVERVAHISNLVSDIAAGASEQSTGLGEINIGVTQLDQVTQQNAAMVEESTAASAALNQDAANLTGLVARFAIRTDGGNNVVDLVTPATGDRAQATAATKEFRSRREPRVAVGDSRGVWQDF